MVRLSWPQRAKDRIGRLKVNSLKLQRNRGNAIEHAGEFGADDAQNRAVLGLRTKAGKRRDNGVERFRFSRFRNLLTLSVYKGLIQIPAEQRIRQIAEVLLQKGGYIMGTLVGAYFGFTAAIKVLP